MQAAARVEALDRTISDAAVGLQAALEDIALADAQQTHLLDEARAARPPLQDLEAKLRVHVAADVVVEIGKLGADRADWGGNPLAVGHIGKSSHRGPPGSGGQAALLYNAQPGASVPHHTHGHDEECLMVQGELFLDDLLLQQGDYQLAPAGTGHRVTETDTGIVIYAHGDLDLKFVA